MATKAQAIDLDALAAAVAQSVAVSTATAQAVEALAESVSSLKADSAKAGKAGSAKAGSAGKAGKAESAASNDYSRGLITLPSAAFGAKVGKGDLLEVTARLLKAGKAAGKAVTTMWAVSKVTETERGERVRADAEREGSALA